MDRENSREENAAEIINLKNDLDLAYMSINTLKTNLDNDRATLELVRDFLDNYRTDHQLDCAYNYNNDGKCSCGRDELTESIKKGLG